MAKPIFVLADLNREYLQSLEIKLLETYKDRIDLEVIDDSQYLEAFLSRTKRIDILIIAEDLYRRFSLQGDIGIVYKLSEENSPAPPDGTAVKTLFKYLNIQKIFGEIEYGARQFVTAAKGQAEKTKIIVVYSALGGIGKTTIALGLCASLVNNHKKVLYVDAENLQDFSFYLSEKEALHSRASSVLSSGNDLFNGLRPYIRNEGFDYLPALRMAASSMDVPLESFRQYVIECKKHVEYDYIVIDTDSVFSEEKDELLQMADRVVLIVQEGNYSKYKTDLLINNFASMDGKKYLAVCNKASAQCNDRMEAFKGKVVDSVIHEMPGSVHLNTLRENREIEQLSYLL